MKTDIDCFACLLRKTGQTLRQCTFPVQLGQKVAWASAAGHIRQIRNHERQALYSVGEMAVFSRPTEK